MTTTLNEATPGPSELTRVVVHLFKGPLYRDSHEHLWEPMRKLRVQVGDYVDVIGLQLEIDESEGYAYLRSRHTGDDEDDMPRLVARHTLSFHLSLLLALLRKRLAEFDASSADPRLVLSRDQIVEMLRVFMPESSNEARLVDNIDGYVRKAVELGFLRRLRGSDDLYEVRRILKAFVDGQWLHELDARLGEYLAELESGSQ